MSRHFICNNCIYKTTAICCSSLSRDTCKRGTESYKKRLKLQQEGLLDDPYSNRYRNNRIKQIQRQD